MIENSSGKEVQRGRNSPHPRRYKPTITISHQFIEQSINKHISFLNATTRHTNHTSFFPIHSIYTRTTRQHQSHLVIFCLPSHNASHPNATIKRHPFIHPCPRTPAPRKNTVTVPKTERYPAPNNPEPKRNMLTIKTNVRC